jgi:hypothetical protein
MSIFQWLSRASSLLPSRVLPSRIVLAAALAGAVVGCASAQSLDYATYKSKVEPIFLKKREGHARCVSCHSAANNSFRLQPLASGATAYTDEQSRKNFEVVSQIVTAGDPASSILLIHPLAKEAGGDEFHSGGRQFTSKNDPDWKTIAAWVSKK